MHKLIQAIAGLTIAAHLLGLANLYLRTATLFRQFDKLEAAYVPWMMLFHCIAVAGGVVVLRKMPGGTSLLGLSTLGVTSLSLSAEFPMLQSWVWVLLFLALALPLMLQARAED